MAVEEGEEDVVEADNHPAEAAGRRAVEAG